MRRTENLKACVVDQYQDSGFFDFRNSSEALVKAWRRAGMRAELSLTDGGHCEAGRWYAHPRSLSSWCTRLVWCART